MKRTLALLSIPFLFAVSACEADVEEPTTAPAPTTEAVVEPTTEDETDEPEAATVTVTAEPEVVTVTAEAAPVAEAEEEPEDEEPAAPAAPAPAPSAGIGERDNPIPVGDDALFRTDSGEVTIALDYANFYANDLITAENMFNEAPQPGNTYVILPITATYSGSGSFSPYFEIYVDYVTADGRSFDEAAIVLPNDMSNVGDIFDGGVATGNFGFEVPEDATEGGTFLITVGWGSDEVFFEAASN